MLITVYSLYKQIPLITIMHHIALLLRTILIVLLHYNKTVLLLLILACLSAIAILMQKFGILSLFSQTR